MKAKILIVEDDKDIADIISRYLKKEDAVPVCRETGEEALEVLKEDSFDLIVLDINLPGMDGYELLSEIRRESQIPVIILSARQEDADMILGFGTGADDYVTKPFSPGVLMARIRAHLKKRDRRDKTNQDVTFGDFTLDMEKRVLLKKGKLINLSPREMDLLIFLAGNPNKTYSQEELYRQVWGNDFGDLSTVSVHIRRLRKKLEEEPSGSRYIQSRYGYGYFLSRDGKE